jgi:hypothetical protein
MEDFRQQTAVRLPYSDHMLCDTSLTFMFSVICPNTLQIRTTGGRNYDLPFHAHLFFKFGKTNLQLLEARLEIKRTVH